MRQVSKNYHGTRKFWMTLSRRVEVLKDCGATQTQGLLNSFGGIY